jgi:hypothetical protein
MKFLPSKHWCRTLGSALIPILLLCAAGQAIAFTAADRNACYNAWWNKYNAAPLGWWTGAETIEMVIDYGNTSHIDTMCNKFTAAYGTNWSSNTFNDDVTWACIAFVRAYTATGNTTYRTIAKNNFDMMYARAWSSALGGGLWWTTSNQYKSACVNFPAAIAAHLLSVALGDSSYATKSQNIYNWGKANLFDASTGTVYDGMNSDGTKNTSSLSYNQGTFAGAAYYRGDTAAGIKSGDWLNGVWGRTMPVYGPTGDSAGFNGIALRWLAKLGYDSAWRQAVANNAWGRRNASNLAGCQWDRATASDINDSWSCSDVVVAMSTVAEDGSKAMLFGDSNYNGIASYGLGPGSYTLSQLQALAYQDNSASSLRVPPGWTVTFYQEDNFTGTSWTFNADTTWVGAANDLMTSCRIVAPATSGVHRVVNVQSGKAIDNGSSTLGSGCVQWTVNDVSGGNQQKWSFTQNSDTSWNIVNKLTNLALEMQSTADGAQVKAWTANGGTNQRWWVDAQSDGTYKIWNQWSGKALENASSSVDGAQIIQWSWGGGNWQRWILP